MAILSQIFVWALLFKAICADDNVLSILEAKIISNGGEVIRVTDAQYNRLATLHNRAIQSWPNLILRPAHYSDVSLALSTLSSLQIPIRILGGRHSYGGYCSHQGIVIDSSLLKQINVNWETETIQVQAGVIWSEVYDVLNGSDYVAVGGLCPTVGVVGFTLGGGYNAIYSRSLGLASDNVLSFKIALYNGTIVTASSNTNADLFWALRGGGGGNFGFVLEMTQRIHRIRNENLIGGQISFLNITWLDTDPKTVLNNWFRFLKDVADNDIRIGFNTLVVISNQSSFIRMSGSFNGPFNQLDSIFNDWLSQSPQPTIYNILNYTQLEVTREMAVPFPVSNREHILSAIVSNMSEQLLDAILSIRPDSTLDIGAWAEFVYLKNAIKDVNTAFAFPDAMFNIAPGVAWSNTQDDGAALKMAQQMIEKIITAGKSSQSILGSYLNYIDPYLKDWEKMYYRDNWARLREIQTQWDPTWYFRFPQGIPPYETLPSLGNMLTMKLFYCSSLVITSFFNRYIF